MRKILLALFLISHINVGLAQQYGPIVITSGGVYSGVFKSFDPDIPVIRIKTTDPVVIENSILLGEGDMITNVHSQGKVNLTIKNCYFYGLKPSKNCRGFGHALRLCSPKDVLFENNYLENTAGISIDGNCDGANDQSRLIIRNNEVKNIVALSVDENGDFYLGKDAQFVQLFKFDNLRNTEIGWNKVVNYPNESAVEDIINIYESSGLDANNPIRIHNNFLKGAYKWPFNSEEGYSGGGILVADGPSALGTASNTNLKCYEDVNTIINEPNLQTSKFTIAEYNHVVSTSHYGIAIATGHDNLIRDNRVVSSGLVRIASDQIRIEAQKWLLENLKWHSYTGIYSYANQFSSSYPIGAEVATYFDNNRVENNYVRWNGYWDGKWPDEGARHGRILSDNRITTLPQFMSCLALPSEGQQYGRADFEDYEFMWNNLNDISSVVSLADEDMEEQIWIDKCITNNISIGPNLSYEDIFVQNRPKDIMIGGMGSMRLNYTFKLYEEAVIIAPNTTLTPMSNIESTVSLNADENLVGYYDNWFRCSSQTSSAARRISDKTDNIHRVSIALDTDVSIYPNPGLDILTIGSVGEEYKSFIGAQFISIDGRREVCFQSHSHNEDGHKINISSLSNGLYVVELHFKGRTPVRKVFLKL